jgi:4-diphosphocytidyl-2-C-methyl-D-erythritol kinase
MISFPPCKINLGLQIIKKRSDGYHDLITCFYPVPWTDILEVIPGSDFSFAISGDAISGKDSDNLCIKAYQLLKRDFALPAIQMHLHKIIPSGAGLGGGSSDAAHTLRMLNDIVNLGLTTAQLQHYAATLGSDCSFFIQDSPMLATGRGEQLSEITLSLAGKFLVLVKPSVHVSTAEAYAGVKPSLPTHDLNEVLQSPIASWKNLLKNDFELSVFHKFPVIKAIKEKLYNAGALYASMSGSGSSVFGIFATEVDLKNEFQNTTYWSGVLEV